MSKIFTVTYITSVIAMCIAVWATSGTKSTLEKIQPYVESIDAISDMKNHAHFVDAKQALKPMLLGNYSCIDYKGSNNTCNFITSSKTLYNKTYLLEKAWLFPRPVIFVETSYRYTFTDGLSCVHKEGCKIDIVQKDDASPIIEKNEIDELANTRIESIFENGEPCTGYLNTPEGLIAITFEGKGIWNREEYNASLITFHPRSPGYRLYDADRFKTK